MISVLLIGMREDDALRKGFRSHVNVFRSCAALEEAKTLLIEADLFLLDSKFGVNSCRTFLSWVRNNTRAIGVIVEDSQCNEICIEAINSDIVCDYLVRPVSPQRYEETWEKYREKLIDGKLAVPVWEKEGTL